MLLKSCHSDRFCIVTVNTSKQNSSLKRHKKMPRIGMHSTKSLQKAKTYC
ncbi:hypothetical protein Psfp_01095 [Pelotomaculum sp. FP]|nr:hypothetical protein Psfp_01095 [Pelotomaculum sp. FP]